MSNPYNAYQSSVNAGDVQLKDWAHAARIFTADNFRLFPKQNFLFHVTFGINQGAVRDLTTIQKYRNEISLLVKSAALPNFTMKTETVNQYNRKKVIQLTHEYAPITIKFRDDSANIVNKLWQNYYGYYYADSTSANQPGAYARNAMQRKPNNSYGLDNRSSIPFFNHITIFQLTRHEYTAYKLINPVITSWNHEGMDYTNPGLHENTMSLAYEAVSYGSGVIGDGADSPDGFGEGLYDTTPSPLSLPPGASSLTRSTGTTTSQTMDIQQLSNITKSINTYQNSQTLTNAGVTGIATNAARTATQGLSGIQGTSFPTSAPLKSVTVAKQIKIL